MWERLWLAVIGFLLLEGCVIPHAYAASIPIRGVVEGFYGTPWTWTQRMDMLRFCGTYGLNAYIYAPKDDPWHRAKWRTPYPKEKLEELRALSDEARKNGVSFIFAVSPGMDIHFTGEQGRADQESMRQKLESIYVLGVRRFALFFDDIPHKNGRGQAAFLNGLEKDFVQKHGDVQPLITVPTEYYWQDMQKNGAAKEYTREFSAALLPEILVLYTGDGVVPEGITAQDMQRADKLYGRRLGVWWNYPVSDYREKKLVLGPVSGLAKELEPAALFFNPMKYEELSKIALTTGAVYAAAPESYEAAAAWEKAIVEQYGSLAPDMELFAAHSQRMENSWAHTGREDAPALRKKMGALWRVWPAGKDADILLYSCKSDFIRMEQAARRLQQGLPATVYKECAPQLELFQDIAEADRIAADRLAAQKNGQTALSKSLYRVLRKKQIHILEREKKAAVSEKTARAFLDEAMDDKEGN